ncbi:hypothetical protein P152DRAFT_485570 [Eremomyces bilateralis CBS 781.70]|uniref:Uncharacterized protein n=1 Tax=Eremomyces bilateralis CBS 781.70 TaxID=1392243 RepID=A0A6G1FRE3_9PEZI|nr:uncharacterized protein P152DRAFT_485570 [Eremomyces bilateralis CBS 781.70]KAF1808296.1 hypothetical protein P152DRAFT_485570 [Eremomyces bilateralis CBS 781.70]
MAIPTPSFLLGIAILAYLGTFVLFALLRIVTGISIQRLGFSGFRRVAFNPKEGVRIEIRGIGFAIHRPTFAQPTWISIKFTELKVLIDLRTLGKSKNKKGRSRWGVWRGNGALLRSTDDGDDDESRPNSPLPGRQSPEPEEESEEEERSRLWKRLTEWKERIKRMHRKIHWIRMFDLVATDSMVVIEDVGTIQMAYFTLAVDTRRKTVDRARLYQNRRTRSAGKKPAEWIMNLRSVLLTPEGKESTEILDNCNLNIHGFLYQHLDGLRDASIGLKLGRVTIPYDDVRTMSERVKHCRRAYGSFDLKDSQSDITFTDLMEEFDAPGSKETSISQTVSDSKEFVSSILRGIQEIQFATTFFGLTKRIRSVQSSGAPVFLDMSMKELGLDLMRLDPKSPAHLMYFSPSDIAHQALIAAISISVGIDDGNDHPERLLYVPMATATVRTTLPSKTIQGSEEKTFAERNTNILFANLVITSPSIDLDPKHLPLIIALMKYQKRTKFTSAPAKRQRHIISRLLPKANIKISIHEPVVRITLPPMDAALRGTDQYDLLISAMSSVSLDVDSSHSAAGDLHYSLSSNSRISSHQLYYQTSEGEKHSLLTTDSLEAKVQISASPDVAVIASFNAQTFSVHMVRPEISEGVRQIVSQIQNDRFLRAPRASLNEPTPSLLRSVPSWLMNAQFQGSDFNIEIAGIDPEISSNAKGVAIHLESWYAEYKANKADELSARIVRKRGSSRTVNPEDILLRPSTPRSPRKRNLRSSDGRRLAIHLHGLDAFVIESSEMWEPTPFLTLPRFEVAFSTSTDGKGPILHINSFTRALYINYSLYRHFAVDLATMVLLRTFIGPLSNQSGRSRSVFSRSSSFPLSPTAPSPTSPKSEFLFPVSEKSSGISSSPSYPRSPDESSTAPDAFMGLTETVTLDFRAAFIQIKASMPADPPLMMQIFSLETGWHRWSAPFARLRFARLYAETPGLKNVWSRLITIKSGRVDLRSARKKSANGVYTDENSIDVAAEAIRVAVPHGLVVHKIFDNLVNVTKTVQQLHHRFTTHSDEYILNKPPQAPKKVPRINIRTQALLGEIEDSPFEWKLGVIYKMGLLEQKQRSTREEAFRIKVKKLKEADKKFGAKHRAKSTHDRKSRPERGSLDEVKPDTHERSKSEGPRGRQRSPSIGGPNVIRYEAEGACGLSDSAKRTVDQSWEALQLLNARSWKTRIDLGLKYQNRGMKDIRAMFWGIDEGHEDSDQRECIMSIPQRPALATIQISDFNFLVDKPSFPINDFPSFLNRIGKGMPRDMKYSILIPMNVHISMGETRMTLRDYPLPLVHIPAIRPGQSPRLPSLSLKTDFVIAEEFRDIESKRMVDVVVVPPETGPDDEQTGGFSVIVPRTVSPVKTFSDISIDINTSGSTRIAWGTSYQPAMQDMMQIIEGFTKPALDPSERVGFWDKLSLCFHSRLLVSWKGDGDVHLILKGSRDPYLVTGVGAGFALCWQNDVAWRIWQENDPRRFMIVESGVFVLAVPDFSAYVRHTQDHTITGQDGSIPISSDPKKPGPIFQKTVMKLTGSVRWLLGLVFERNLPHGGRSFDFKHHYDVVLKHPKYAKSRDGLNYDAYRGFRSHHIHMSIAVAAPIDRDWTVTNLKASNNYNSVHLTPRFFSHFFSWWSMFSGVLSLPVRQGKLWPNAPVKPSKKFGRHLATIKYNLLLSPLYMSHIYTHSEGNAGGQVNATGLKVKIDSFMLDLHQRREEFRKMVQGKLSKTTAIRINQAQVDFMAADIRAVSATMTTPGINDLHVTEDDYPGRLSSETPIDLSKFTIPDNDLRWVDMDDFREMDWAIPTQSNPETKILPLAFAPRFTYFRQTDHNETISGDPNRSSPFGYEDTHYCVMSARNDPRRVQCDLIQARLEQIDEQIMRHRRTLGEHELNLVKSVDSDAGPLQEQFGVLQDHDNTLRKKKAFLQAMLKTLVERLEKDAEFMAKDPEAADDIFFEANEQSEDPDAETEAMASAPLADYLSDSNNRFIVHNSQVKWNNSLRNIIMRYIHEASQRRGFVYYMSRRAVKFILDIVDEQNKLKTEHPDVEEALATPTTAPVTPQKDDETNIQGRIQELLDDARQFVTADDPDEKDGSGINRTADAGEDISLDFTAQNSYHVRLIAPQIQLQSDKNPKSAVLVTAKGMQMKVIQIMDKDRMTDDVSGLVQRRFTLATDSVQIFVTNSKTFPRNLLHMYSGSRYGAPAGSAWPPWVPLEVMFEFSIDPFGFSRVIQRTSVTMRYDKYNNLRLKYNDDVTTGNDDQPLPEAEKGERRMDHIWVEFPHLRVTCDSTQYYALYVIILDLLLYSEPLEKTRNERLEKIMLASDFSDLSGTPEMVEMLQERIRQLEEIKLVFQVRERYLDAQGWKGRIAVEHDLSVAEDDLFFMMKAITTAQRKYEEKGSAMDTTGMLRWLISASEIKWHLIRGKDESLAELQLQGACFDRVDQSDGSNRNTMEIAQIRGYNLLSNALYPEIIGPYSDDAKGIPDSREAKMIRVHWYMLEAIGGIPVMNNFEVNIHPIKLQLEKDVGIKLFEYIFPQAGPNAFENGSFSPFLVKNMLPAQEEEDEKVDAGQVDDEVSTGIGSDISHHTGTEDFELRLQPTLDLPSRRQKSSGKPKSRHLYHLHLFNSSDAAGNKTPILPSRDFSSDSLSQLSRPPSHPDGSERSSTQLTERPDRGKRFGLHRSPTGGTRSTAKTSRPDDITQMMKRASNYMTLAYVKIPSVVLCLSYKGKGQRNFEDVHNLVFRLPTLEYRNKTWSNYDLAMQLKREVRRALISHVGAIVGNKFSRHKTPGIPGGRLKEIANSTTLLSMTPSRSEATSETTSTRDLSDVLAGDTDDSYSESQAGESNRNEEDSLASSVHSSSTAPVARGSPVVQHDFVTAEQSVATGSNGIDDESSRRPPSVHSSLAKRLTGLGGKSKDNSGDDSASTRRKSKLLLGKRFLQH